MSEQPMIVRFEKSQCVRYEQRYRRFVSVIEHIGIDNEGKRWKFYRDNWDNESGYRMTGELYGFQEVK